MKPLKYFFLTVFSLTVVCFSSLTASSLDDSDCMDYEFIFARGSGQSLNDVDFRALKEKVEAKLGDEIRYEFYELGTANNGYLAYSPDGIPSVLETYISAGESYKFGESVERGTEELISHVKNGIKRCKNKRYILVGYSQGAFVIDKALPYLNSDKIYYVASFGDPKLNLPEGKNGNACKNIGLSSYRVYVPDCEVEEGILGGQNPYETNDLKNKRGAWCNQNDFICGSRLNLLNLWGGHTSYTEETGYEKFAKLISDKIKNSVEPTQETEARYSDYQKRDVIVLFNYGEKFHIYGCHDCDSIVPGMRELLVNLASHGTRIAVYNYYALANSTIHLEEMIPFTNDNLAEKIDDYNTENIVRWYNYIAGGGDNMYYAIKELSRNGGWSDGAERNIYIIRSFLSTLRNSFDGTTLSEAVKIAKENNVKIYAFNYGGGVALTMKEISEETGGEAIGTDYDKIVLDKAETKKIPKYSSRTFELNRDSKYTLVIINDMIYGLSDKDKITIKDIDEDRENKIVLISYNDAGKIEKKETHIIGSLKASPPDSGKLKL